VVDKLLAAGAVLHRAFLVSDADPLNFACAHNVADRIE
jgi:hypothetical protein